jgi:hypothetical protein
MANERSFFHLENIEFHFHLVSWLVGGPVQQGLFLKRQLHLIFNIKIEDYMKLVEKTNKITADRLGGDVKEDEFMFVGAVFSSDLPGESSRLSAFQNALGIHPCETIYLKKINWGETLQDHE